MASATVSAQTTSVQLTATTNEADITLDSANKLTARVGSGEGAAGTAGNPPRLELAADAGVQVAGDQAAPHYDTDDELEMEQIDYDW